MSFAPAGYAVGKYYNRVRWSDGRAGVFSHGHVDLEQFLFDTLPLLEAMFYEVPRIETGQVRHVYFRLGPRTGRVYFCKPEHPSAFTVTLLLLPGQSVRADFWE